MPTAASTSLPKVSAFIVISGSIQIGTNAVARTGGGGAAHSS